MRRRLLGPAFLEPDDVQHLLAQLSPRDRPIAAVAVYAGLRKGELFGLRKVDVDLARRFLMVRRSYDPATTKGGRGGGADRGRASAVPRGGARARQTFNVGEWSIFRGLAVARLAGVEPAARGFEVRSGELTASPGASRSVTLRGVTGLPTSPKVPTHPDNPGQFAAVVLQGFAGKLVSPREAAGLLGVNRETIYRLCARGDLPHVRVGSVLRVDLAAYLARRRQS